MLAEIEPRISADAIIASNTSGIPITKIAAKLAHPERVIGWHWSNPPHLIPMNEVINGERTAPEVTAAIEELTRRIGYHPVTLKKEVPGFVENRVLYAIMRECLALVDEGVIDVEGLDLCVKWGIGYKLAVIPPIQLLDMAGLDIYTAVASFLNADLSNETGISKTATDLRDEGRLGIKTGARLLRVHAGAHRGAAAAARRGARRRAKGAELRWPARRGFACSTAARWSSTSRTSPGTSAAARRCASRSTAS